MNPVKVNREKIDHFTDLPNIGAASAKDFELLGFKHPSELQGADPFELYKKLCRITNSEHDPCVLDVLMSVTDFLAGNPAQPWWYYTEERKRRYVNLRGDN